MTYEEIVDHVRHMYENADARSIFEHIAIQVNIVGEGAGAFYVEVAERHICVEPYDYRDRDGLITAQADDLMELAMRKITFDEAIASGKIQYVGNVDKIKKLANVKFKKK